MFVALPELFNVVQQILLGLNVSVMSRSFELPDDFPNPNARQSKSRCSVPSFPITEVLLQVSLFHFFSHLYLELLFLPARCGLAL